MFAVLRSVLESLREQHTVDLAVYRSAHQHEGNRRLHVVLIPLEVASFLWLLTVLVANWHAATTWAPQRTDNKASFTSTKVQSLSSSLVSLLVASLGCTMGILSWIVASNPVMGIIIFLLHVAMVQWCLVIQQQQQQYRFTAVVLLPPLVVWMLSWTLQIGVGHYWMEQRAPNLFHPDDTVSWLSTLTSIVLAWEC